MDRVLSDLQPGLGTTAIVGELTLTKTGTTARTVTFPDAAISVARTDAAQTFTGLQSFATLTATGQITSTVATGTAPLVIASTTAVANLNASLLLGQTWANPGAIGGTTPAAISCTTLTTTAGDITVATAGGGASYAFTAGVFGQMVKWQRYGYSTSYTALQLGNATHGLGFGIDPNTNVGGQFYGDNRDIFFRRGAHIGCQDAAGTDWVWALRISGGASSNSSHILELTDTSAVFTTKITTVSAVPGSFADLAAVQTWLAANFT